MGVAGVELQRPALRVDALRHALAQRAERLEGRGRHRDQQLPQMRAGAAAAQAGMHLAAPAVRHAEADERPQRLPAAGAFGIGRGMHEGGHADHPQRRVKHEPHAHVVDRRAGRHGAVAGMRHEVPWLPVHHAALDLEQPVAAAEAVHFDPAGVQRLPLRVGGRHAGVPVAGHARFIVAASMTKR
jgi:hypothetical protein